jgi:ATPase
MTKGKKMFKQNSAKNQTRTQQIKTRARKNLNRKFEKKKTNYVVDTSVIINKFLPRLIEKGLKGKLMIPNAVIAELENLANKGREAGFIGLEEVANLHKLKKKHSLTISFVGQRPDIKHIKYAKSGEIDALIRGLAFKNRATLITADLVQAKSAQAYGLEVLFLKPKFVRKKKSWLSFFKK